jgi:hypothetical protein
MNAVCLIQFLQEADILEINCLAIIRIQSVSETHALNCTHKTDFDSSFTGYSAYLLNSRLQRDIMI